MLELIDTIQHRSRYIFVAVLVIVNILLLSWMITEIQRHPVHAAASNNADSSNALFGDVGSANVVTNGFNDMAAAAGQAASSFAAGVNDSLGSTGSSIASAGRFLGNGLYEGVRGVGHAAAVSLLFTAQIIGNGLAAIFYAPSHIFGFVAKASPVSALVTPAYSAHVPVIDPYAIDLYTTKVAAVTTPKVEAAAATTSSATQWPIHGNITTPFGVPELPYQAIHTGIDISDGNRPGVTPVHPFKAGRVLATIWGNTGLGNHVVIDHGNGMTSVYGHLASISVATGQQVDLGTVVGYEGSTGVSTGTHLHFEVWLNGVAVDAHRFILGQPYF